MGAWSQYKNAQYGFSLRYPSEAKKVGENASTIRFQNYSLDEDRQLELQHGDLIIEIVIIAKSPDQDGCTVLLSDSHVVALGSIQGLRGKVAWEGNPDPASVVCAERQDHYILIQTVEGGTTNPRGNAILESVLFN